MPQVILPPVVQVVPVLQVQLQAQPLLTQVVVAAAEILQADQAALAAAATAKVEILLDKQLMEQQTPVVEVEVPAVMKLHCQEEMAGLVL
jgi:hypothetical protein